MFGGQYTGEFDLVRGERPAWERLGPLQGPNFGVLAELAALKARREVKRSRRCARRVLQNRLDTCFTEKERHDAAKWVRRCYPEPDPHKLIADYLRSWGVSDRAPSRRTLQRYRQLVAPIRSFLARLIADLKR